MIVNAQTHLSHAKHTRSQHPHANYVDNTIAKVQVRQQKQRTCVFQFSTVSSLFVFLLSLSLSQPPPSKTPSLHLSFPPPFHNTHARILFSPSISNRCTSLSLGAGAIHEAESADRWSRHWRIVLGESVAARWSEIRNLREGPRNQAIGSVCRKKKWCATLSGQAS